jgi:N-formylglutamate deformylase
MPDLFRCQPGETPLIVSSPHDGTFVPSEIAARFTPEARALPDSDWHVSRVYDFAAGLGASTLFATHSRYVVDLNRDPSGEVLYPGADNTEIVPTTTFDRRPIYRDGQTPDDAEIAERIERWFRPYHETLRSEIDRVRARFGFAVLFDAHSIRSEVPRFFRGVLPDLNLGSARGQSADAELSRRAFAVLEGASGFSAVRDGRFTGGYTTRHYGQPAERVHALQLELAQKTYMNETPPYPFREDRAAELRPVLRRLLETLLDWARERR